MSDTPNNTKTSTKDSSQKTSNVEKVIAEVIDSPESGSHNSKQSNSNQEINLANIIKFLDLYLVQKAPSLPKNVKDWLFKYYPLLTKIGLVLIGVSSLFYIVALVFAPFLSLFGLIGNAIGAFYSWKALPKLEKSDYDGWLDIFKGTLLSIGIGFVGSIFYVDTLNTLVQYLIIMTIAFYVHFQIRSYYKIKA